MVPFRGTLRAALFPLLLFFFTPAIARADSLGVGFVTCITPVGSLNCTQVGSAPVYWRVINTMSLTSIASPFEGANTLHDVVLEFEYVGGSRRWTWDVIEPVGLPGTGFGETDPFDATLVSNLISLRISATLARTVFDPVFVGDDRISFVAESPFVSATTTSFPPPLNLWAEGQFETAPVPEPGTVTFVLLGLCGIGSLRRRLS